MNKRPPLRRGYRIRTYERGKPSMTSSTIWSEDVPLGAWEEAKRNPRAVRVELYRSGRKIERFVRR